MTANLNPQPVSTGTSSDHAPPSIYTTIAQQFSSCTLFHGADANAAEAFTASTFRQDIRQRMAEQFTSSIFHRHPYSSQN